PRPLHSFPTRRSSDLQHLVETLIRLTVHRKARQTIHPCRRTLQREHQLSLRLLLGLGERVAAQPLARELGILGANRRGGLRRRLDRKSTRLNSSHQII